MSQSWKTEPVSAPGTEGTEGVPGTVREKRGAGAACGMPSISMMVPRAAMCGLAGTSVNDSTGVTQASRSANSAAHSSRVRVANAAAITARRTGQPDSSSCAGSPAGFSPRPSSSSA